MIVATNSTLFQLIHACCTSPLENVRKEAQQYILKLSQQDFEEELVTMASMSGQPQFQRYVSMTIRLVIRSNTPQDELYDQSSPKITPKLLITCYQFLSIAQTFSNQPPNRINQILNDFIQVTAQYYSAGGKNNHKLFCIENLNSMMDPQFQSLWAKVFKQIRTQRKIRIIHVPSRLLEALKQITTTVNVNRAHFLLQLSLYRNYLPSQDLLRKIMPHVNTPEIQETLFELIGEFSLVLSWFGYSVINNLVVRGFQYLFRLAQEDQMVNCIGFLKGMTQVLNKKLVTIQQVKRLISSQQSEQSWPNDTHGPYQPQIHDNNHLLWPFLNRIGIYQLTYRSFHHQLIFLLSYLYERFPFTDFSNCIRTVFENIDSDQLPQMMSALGSQEKLLSIMQFLPASITIHMNVKEIVNQSFLKYESQRAQADMLGENMNHQALSRANHTQLDRTLLFLINFFNQSYYIDSQLLTVVTSYVGELTKRLFEYHICSNNNTHPFLTNQLSQNGVPYCLHQISQLSSLTYDFKPFSPIQPIGSLLPLALCCLSKAISKCSELAQQIRYYYLSIFQYVIGVQWMRSVYPCKITNDPAQNSQVNQLSSSEHNLVAAMALLLESPKMLAEQPLTKINYGDGSFNSHPMANAFLKIIYGLARDYYGRVRIGELLGQQGNLYYQSDYFGTLIIQIYCLLIFKTQIHCLINPLLISLILPKQYNQINSQSIRQLVPISNRFPHSSHQILTILLSAFKQFYVRHGMDPITSIEIGKLFKHSWFHIIVNGCSPNQRDQLFESDMFQQLSQVCSTLISTLFPNGCPHPSNNHQMDLNYIHALQVIQAWLPIELQMYIPTYQNLKTGQIISTFQHDTNLSHIHSNITPSTFLLNWTIKLFSISPSLTNFCLNIAYDSLVESYPVIVALMVEDGVSRQWINSKGWWDTQSIHFEDPTNQYQTNSLNNYSPQTKINHRLKVPSIFYSTRQKILLYQMNQMNLTQQSAERDTTPTLINSRNKFQWIEEIEQIKAVCLVDTQIAQWLHKKRIIKKESLSDLRFY